MDFPTTVNELKNYTHCFGSKNEVRIFIEEIGYQKALIDELKKQNYCQVPRFSRPLSETCNAN